MMEIRCPACNRFLGKADGNAQIKCAPCKSWFLFKIDKGAVKSLRFTHTRISA